MSHLGLMLFFAFVIKSSINEPFSLELPKIFKNNRSNKTELDELECEDTRLIHSYALGPGSSNDRMVYMNIPTKRSKIMSTVKEDIVYPLGGESGKIISYIVVFDLMNDGSGGCVYLLKGGVGQNNVWLHIKSKKNKGYHFVIRIYSQE